MTPNFNVKYDRNADVLYVTVRRVPADTREEMPGLLWRYSLDEGALVGLTILDYHLYWEPRLDLLASEVARRFAVSREAAKDVLTSVH